MGLRALMGLRTLYVPVVLLLINVLLNCVLCTIIACIPAYVSMYRPLVSLHSLARAFAPFCIDLSYFFDLKCIRACMSLYLSTIL
jgi:hypothetical protein